MLILSLFWLTHCEHCLRVNVCLCVFSVQPDSHYTTVELTQQERQQQAQQRHIHLKSFPLNQVVYGTDCSSLLEGR